MASSLTHDQAAILEAFFAHCPSPSASQRQELLRDDRLHLDDAQIQTWFQNRREREKERKRELGVVREMLLAEKTVLMEENVKLKKTVIQLACENDALRRNRRVHRDDVDDDKDDDDHN